MPHCFVSFPQEGLAVLFKVPLPNIILFLVELGQWKGIVDLDGFCIKRNNHGNNWKIICYEAELATLPCHFEMCAEVFSSICRGTSSKVSYFPSLSFCASWPLASVLCLLGGSPFYCLYVYKSLFGIMGIYVLVMRIIVKRSARQIREVKLALKLQLNSFFFT